MINYLEFRYNLNILTCLKQEPDRGAGETGSTWRVAETSCKESYGGGQGEGLGIII